MNPELNIVKVNNYCTFGSSRALIRNEVAISTTDSFDFDLFERVGEQTFAPINFRSSPSSKIRFSDGALFAVFIIPPSSKLTRVF